MKLSKQLFKTFFSTMQPLVFIFVVITLSACSQKFHFNNSSVIPSAEGTVVVKSDKNENNNIKLNVEHLADPSRLSPPHNTYVVWMKTADNGTRNIGQLDASSGLFSNNRKASMETISPYHPVGFFITAEDKADTLYPGLIVLETDTQ